MFVFSGIIIPRRYNIYYSRKPKVDLKEQLLEILCETFRALTIHRFHAAAARSLQSCPTLCSPGDSSPPGSPVPGILQARTLEWVVISFSNA